MRTLLPDPPPAEFQALLEQRRRWGADTRDEVWEGVLHMNPAPHARHAQVQAQLLELLGPLARARGLTSVGEFNLGQADDYRVPDAGLLPAGGGALYNPSATLVVEVVSPGDESWEKLPFYASHQVQELVIVDPDKRDVHWLGLIDGEYRRLARSAVLDFAVDELALSWPQ